jgi:probable phosphoglycerate mutase
MELRDYEGRSSTDIQLGRSGWNIWCDGCPNGETSANIADRADRLVHRLRALTGNIALLAHGQIAAALAERWIGLPLGEGQHLALAPGSLSILEYECGHPTVPVIALWNAYSDPVVYGRNAGIVG